MSATFAARRRAAAASHRSLCQVLAKCIKCEPLHKCGDGDCKLHSVQGGDGRCCACESEQSELPVARTTAPLPPPVSVLDLPSPPTNPPSPPSTNDFGVCADLGISISTFRKLKSLQQRELEPEDYDLLIRLHSKPTTRVLDDAMREKVCVTFRAPTGYVPPNAGGACAVCLCALAVGEELTQLTCEGQHVFHSHCIREWLSSASRCCPVDNQDLSMQCLTA